MEILLLYHVMTRDETWVHHYVPENKNTVEVHFLSICQKVQIAGFKRKSDDNGFLG